MGVWAGAYWTEKKQKISGAFLLALRRGRVGESISPIQRKAPIGLRGSLDPKRNDGKKGVGRVGPKPSVWSQTPGGA